MQSAGSAERTLLATAAPAAVSRHSFSVLPTSAKSEGVESSEGPWWVTSYATRYPGGAFADNPLNTACIHAGAAGARDRALPPKSALVMFPVTWTVRTGTGLTEECLERKMMRSASMSRSRWSW
ncbi:MAG: hypothetical protein A4E39_00176 [Methanoregulaceae archaeon PtaB.Bin152]|nr:MAG: hypothetical protein A4E39_00176 [Methanoregulaceae archaeon PtaB.Bin152]